MRNEPLCFPRPAAIALRKFELPLLRTIAGALIFYFAFGCSPGAKAQGLTGQISGTVADTAGALVAGAKVTVRNAGTGQTKDIESDSSGTFLITDLLPGQYELEVTASGFKRYEQKGIPLSATERVTLREIVLQLGQLSESVTVTSEAARLQTQSAERSGLINSGQMQQLSLKGRDYLSMTRLLPGVSDSANREAPGFNSIQGININGNREHTINLTLDGVSNLDTGSMSGPFISPSLDAISEVRVLLTNYQAEYGRSSGGTINVIVKSGTRDFHGGVYYFIRNDALNANEFFNNRQGQPRPRYHYNNAGYNVGGPVLIPKLRDARNRLFFFWSEETLPRNEPQAQLRRTFPTALERNGDFSKTLDTNGKLIQILDPLNNRQPFPGNMIPATRIDPAGQGLLKVFPLPNVNDPTNTFNNAFQNIVDHPWRQELLRVDWNISSKNLFYARGIQTSEAFKSAMDTNLGARNWTQFPTNYQLRGYGLVATLIHTFSPTTVNEFTFGVNRGTQTISPLNAQALAMNSRKALNLNLPQLYPQNNPLDLIPNATFGGVSNAPALDIESRFPYSGTNNIWNWSDNLTKIIGSHNIKVGLYIENTVRNGNRVGTPTGQFDFSRDVNNPYDANYAFANALLGSVTSYSESDTRPYSRAHYQNYEWFIQDNWRLTHRLTLDIGMRFYRIIPTYLAGEKAAAFAPGQYSAAAAPLLIQPYKATPTSARTGINPLTGEVVPALLIGTYVPGTGNPTNGMNVTSERVMNTPPVTYAPRIGFALDVLGNGKTAIRGGFGIFPDRLTDTTITQFVEQPPVNNTPTAYYTTIQQLLNTRLTRSPSAVKGIQADFQPQASYNWSFGVQQDLGKGIVLDAAYVGNVGRHLQQVRNLNATRYGTNFLASSADATQAGLPLPANFLRPVRGYADILYYEFAGTSNYNSLQTQVNKRFSKSLMFAGVWTWSKAMNLSDSEGTTLNPYIDPRIRNYGKAGYDHTHNLTINLVYALPRLSERWNNGFTRVTGDGWQISSIASFISGKPLGFTYTFVTAKDITGATGSGIDSRVNLTGDPNLPKDERTFSRAFRTEVVRAPDASTFGIGNAPKDAIRGPGTNNWDISLFKNFRMGKNESRYLQFRWETYNTFNHTQFNAVDTAARFDAAGNQTSTSFGSYTGAAPARRMQLGLKFYF